MSNFIIKNNIEAPEAEIQIMGDIGASWFGEGVTAQSVITELNGLKGRPISCTVQSLGGDLGDALAIYDALRMHDSKVTTKVVGLTASSGTVIAMAGEERFMSNSAAFLIHQAQGGMVGNSDDLLKQSRELAKFDGILANLYAERTGKPSTEMYNLMKQEIWQTADEALKNGFVTGLLNTSTILNTIEVNEISNKLNINPLKNKLSMTQEEIDALVAENEALKGKVSELEAKLAEIDASMAQEEEQKMLSEDEAIVEAACTEKKIGAELKNHYLNLMKKDREGIRNLIKELPVIEPRRAIDDIKNAKPQADNDLIAKVAKLRAKNQFTRWASENPDEYARYKTIKNK